MTTAYHYRRKKGRLVLRKVTVSKLTPKHEKDTQETRQAPPPEVNR